MEPVGWSVTTVDYCLEHVPTSKLAQMNRQPIYPPRPEDRSFFAYRKCYICNCRIG